MFVMKLEKPFWMVYITHMFIEIHFLTQVALIPIFMLEFGLTILEASLVASVPSLIQLIINVPLGVLVDRFNVKFFLFTGLLIAGTSAFLISQTNSFWVLILGVSVLRISTPIYHISGLSMIGRIEKPERMSRSIGFHNAFGSLGSAIGVISLAIFISTLGWRWVYLFWAFPILAWGFVILGSSQLGAEPVEKRGLLKRDGFSKWQLVFFSGFLTFLVAIGLREVGITGTLTFLTTYLKNAMGLPEATAILIFGLGPIMGIIGSLSGGFIGEMIGAKRALSVTILGCAISLFGLMLSSQLYLLILIYLIFAMLSFSAYVPMNTIVAGITSPTEMGIGFSAYFFTEGLIISITPIILASIIGLTDIWQIFPFSIIFLVSSLIILQFVRYPRPTR